MNESLSINKNIQSGSKNLPQCYPYLGCLLHGKSFLYIAQRNTWYPSGISGVYDQSGV